MGLVAPLHSLVLKTTQSSHFMVKIHCHMNSNYGYYLPFTLIKTCFFLIKYNKKRKLVLIKQKMSQTLKFSLKKCFIFLLKKTEHGSHRTRHLTRAKYLRSMFV